MKSPKILLRVGVMLFAASTVSYAQNKSKKKADAPKVEHCDGDCCKANSYGYYKDVFMDSGINVTSRRDLPATRFLGLSMEAFVSAPHSPNKLTLRDTVIQNEMICGSADDLNGILLYPDGEPRFRMIYMNGGRATKHGNSLTPKGRANIQQFLAKPAVRFNSIPLFSQQMGWKIRQIQRQIHNRRIFSFANLFLQDINRHKLSSTHFSLL